MGLNLNIIGFFNSYHSNFSTTYTWNSFSSLPFSTNVGVGQGSALSPIISIIYLAPIIKTFKKRIKSLKEKIPIDILSFVNDSLLISQKKSYDLSFSFLLCNYNIMLKILLDSSLVMKHSKSEVFHFIRFHYSPNLSINLTSVRGPILTPKPIWHYLSFFFDRKLTFYYYIYFYATKCLSILNAMKLLGNSSQGIFPIQKRLLYRLCVLPIALYKFQLWFFKKVPIHKNISKLKRYNIELLYRS